MAAAVVDLTDTASRRLVLVEQALGGLVEGVGEDAGAGVAIGLGQVTQRLGQREELTEAVPAQVVLLDQLLHVLGCRAAGPGLEEATAVHQRHDGEHLGAGAELEDGEEVGVVVTQDVAGHRDRVLALADPLDGELRGVGGGEDADVEALGVVLLEVFLDLRDEVGVVGAGLVEPEDRGVAGGAGACDGELDPVLDRGVLGLAGPPDVASLDLVLHEHVAGRVDDLDAAGCGHLEGLVVAAVFLGLLCHEPDVGHRAHGGGVVCAIGPAVVDDGLIDAGIGGVGDDGKSVGLGAVGAPHVAGGADHRGHGGVDDDVARDVQAGDALVGVDHREAGAVGHRLVEGSLDLGAVVERVESGEDGGEAVGAVEASGQQLLAVCRIDVLEVGADHVAEDDRVGDLHHRRLEVDREEDVFGLGAGDLLGEEGVEGGRTDEGAVDDLAGQDLQAVLEHRLGAVGAEVLDRQGVIGGEDDGLLVAAEVVLAHGRDIGLAVAAPRTHGVGVVAGVVLDRCGGAAVGVALAQHGVDRAALDLVITGAGVALLVGLGLVRIVRQGDALGLQLGDGRLELGDRGGDIGQLDDVGLGRRGQLTQLGERVPHALVLGQEVGEGRHDAPREGDIARLDLHAGRGGEGLDDREEGVRRQQRRLIGQGVDDLGHLFGFSFSVMLRTRRVTTGYRDLRATSDVGLVP